MLTTSLDAATLDYMTNNKNTYMGQKVLFKTFLFGKSYFWMQDGDGTVYLAKETDGLPDFS